MNETPEQQTPETCSHNCGSCSSSCGERTEPQKLSPNAASKVTKVIGVVSSKGGVGKTLVTSSRIGASKAGSVGIMDAM
ncbi:MAG: hypothetical protein ACLTQI_05600 [Slackia sp.]